MPTAPGEPPRKRGRPRSRSVDAAIHAAVVELLDRDGYTGLRVDDVAERSGVSKTTIYRRWPTKAALVVGVLRRIKDEQIPMPATGDAELDLRAIITDQWSSLHGTTFGRALPGLIAEKAGDPDLTAAIERLSADRRTLVAEVIRRGMANGQLRADLDVAMIVELLAGPAYYRLLVTGQHLDARTARRHADALYSGIRSAVALRPADDRDAG